MVGGWSSDSRSRHPIEQGAHSWSGAHTRSQVSCLADCKGATARHDNWIELLYEVPTVRFPESFFEHTYRICIVGTPRYMCMHKHQVISKVRTCIVQIGLKEDMQIKILPSSTVLFDANFNIDPIDPLRDASLIGSSMRRFPVRDRERSPASDARGCLRGDPS